MDSLQPVVFIVSGVASLRSELSAMLAGCGLSVTEIGSAAEYLTHSRRALAACLIVDVDLPDMSGFELQQRIRGTDASVVIVSRIGNIRESVRAMKGGAIDYLPAPMDAAALLYAVHAAIAENHVAHGQRLRFASLTPREREIANMVVRGLRNKIIAADLGISMVTVQIHRGNIMRKMRARSLPDLVRMGDALGFSESQSMAATA